MATPRPSTATGRRKTAKPPAPPKRVTNATAKALKAAEHLTEMDAGAREVLLVLADRIDQMTALPLEQLAASKDNVTIPTYLKACHELGLTPAGRLKYDPAKKGGGGVSSLTRRRNAVAATRRS